MWENSGVLILSEGRSPNLAHSVFANTFKNAWVAKDEVGETGMDAHTLQCEADSWWELTQGTAGRSAPTWMGRRSEKGAVCGHVWLVHWAVETLTAFGNSCTPIKKKKNAWEKERYTRRKCWQWFSLDGRFFTVSLHNVKMFFMFSTLLLLQSGRKHFKWSQRTHCNNCLYLCKTERSPYGVCCVYDSLVDFIWFNCFDQWIKVLGARGVCSRLASGVLLTEQWNDYDSCPVIAFVCWIQQRWFLMICIPFLHPRN